jgi:hypothetical protein
MIELKSILTIPTGATPLRIQLTSDNLMSPPTDARTYRAPRHPAQRQSLDEQLSGGVLRVGAGRVCG